MKQDNMQGYIMIALAAGVLAGMIGTHYGKNGCHGCNDSRKELNQCSSTSFVINSDDRKLIHNQSSDVLYLGDFAMITDNYCNGSVDYILDDSDKIYISCFRTGTPQCNPQELSEAERVLREFKEAHDYAGFSSHDLSDKLKKF